MPKSSIKALSRQDHSLVVQAGDSIPAAVAELGEDASYRFLEFFTAHIRNPNTRAAYARAVKQFFEWCPVDLHAITSIHIATYVETLSERLSPPTVKQHLAAIRMLFDWLILGQVMPSNPASAVRGPKHVVKKGKTPILSAEEVRRLFDSINTDTVIGQRDRALLGVLLYTFARISATIGMNQQDLFVQNRRTWVRLKEKGGKAHEMPCHHTLEEYLHDYQELALVKKQDKAPLFQSTGRGKGGQLTGRRLSRQEAYAMVGRRLHQAGIQTQAGNHTFRASGITIYLENGGLVEHAQQMAAHESPRTTKLYDRRADTVSLDEVEKIII
ncbi:MAG: tyrosine-type recombinase/integrase [Methyloligellaceae bacterium]